MDNDKINKIAQSVNSWDEETENIVVSELTRKGVIKSENTLNEVYEEKFEKLHTITKLYSEVLKNLETYSKEQSMVSLKSVEMLQGYFIRFDANIDNFVEKVYHIKEYLVDYSKKDKESNKYYSLAFLFTGITIGMICGYPMSIYAQTSWGLISIIYLSIFISLGAMLGFLLGLFVYSKS